MQNYNTSRLHEYLSGRYEEAERGEVGCTTVVRGMAYCVPTQSGCDRQVYRQGPVTLTLPLDP